MKTLRQPQRIKNFSRRFAHHFVNDRCPELAGTLAYTSLLALVPLMAVSFTLFTAFPAFGGLMNEIQHFIFSNFIPASGKILEAYLQDFVDKASALALPSFIVLLATALLSMSTIERTFNGIWKVRRRRNPVDTFMVYWAVLTMGPLLIGVGLVATSHVASLPFFSDATRGPGGLEVLISLLSFLIAVLAFALLYAIVPYRRVHTRHAMAGGMVAAVLFELVRGVFVLFVTHFAAHEGIYGAFAALPIFLFWVYLSWLIILAGAEFTYCLNPPTQNPPTQNPPTPDNPTLDNPTPMPNPVASQVRHRI